MENVILNFISIMTWGKLHFWILPTGKPIHLLLIYYLFLFFESLFFILWILTLNLQQGDFCISFVSTSWIYWTMKGRKLWLQEYFITQCFVTCGASSLMVIVSILPHAEFGRNDHREGRVPHFIIPNSHIWYLLQRILVTLPQFSSLLQIEALYVTQNNFLK